jgi:hypothetical protein
MIGRQPETDGSVRHVNGAVFVSSRRVAMGGPP